MSTPDKQLSAEQSRQVAETIREEIARRRISRQHLAEQAKLSISTLEKVLGGRRPFTLATTVRLEQALGVSLRKAPDSRLRCAGQRRHRAGRPRRLFAALGGLARGQLCDAAAVVRRQGLRSMPIAPKSRGRLRRHAWCSARCERQDAAYTQFGDVAVPNQSGTFISSPTGTASIG